MKLLITFQRGKDDMENDKENVLIKSEKIGFKGKIDKILGIFPDYLSSRILSTVVLIPVALIIIYSTSFFFSICIVAVAIIMAYEWIILTNREKVEENNFSDGKWKILGLFYILIPLSSLIYIQNLQTEASSSFGSDIVLWLFLIIWATDIGGLIVGKSVGGIKLAPKISPKKTCSGLIGGVLLSMFVGLLSSVMFKGSTTFFILFSGILAVFEQISDLIESKVKRIFGVKDSGNLIPGHGGILDRIDGLTLTAPILALVVIFSNNIF
jgi:phosphatidate cytidylyltransferase